MVWGLRERLPGEKLQEREVCQRGGGTGAARSGKAFLAQQECRQRSWKELVRRRLKQLEIFRVEEEKRLVREDDVAGRCLREIPCRSHRLRWPLLGEPPTSGHES